MFICWIDFECFALLWLKYDLKFIKNGFDYGILCVMPSFDNFVCMLNLVSYISIKRIIRFYKEIINLIQEFTKDVWE